MLMQDCPEFVRCSAAICPLDPQWDKRYYSPGEPVCLIMREHAKPGADARFERYPLFKPIREAAIPIIEIMKEMRAAAGEGQPARGFGGLLYQIEASALTGSSLDKREAAGKRMRKSDGEEDE